MFTYMACNTQKGHSDMCVKCRVRLACTVCAGSSETTHRVLCNFYAPVSKDRGHIVLPLSVCPSVRLHKLNMKTLHFPITPKII